MPDEGRDGTRPGLVADVQESVRTKAMMQENQRAAVQVLGASGVRLDDSGRGGEVRVFEVIEQLRKQGWRAVELPGTPGSTLSKKGRWSFDLPFHPNKVVSPEWLEWLFVVVGMKAKAGDLYPQATWSEGPKGQPSRAVRDLNPDVSSLTWTKPTRLTVKGRRTTVRSWASLIREAGSLCAASGKPLPAKLTPEQRRPYSSRRARGLRRAHDVGHGWFVESNMEAERAGEFVRLLLRGAGLESGDVAVTIHHVHMNWEATLRL